MNGWPILNKWREQPLANVANLRFALRCFTSSLNISLLWYHIAVSCINKHYNFPGNPEDHLVRLHCNATTQAWNERFEKDSCYDYLTKYAPLVQFEATTHVSLLNSSEFYDNDFLQASKFVGQEENAPQLVSEIEYFICMSKSGILSLLK